MTHSIYCALCDDGPFKRCIAPPTHERVIQGFYFCAWCYEYADWNRRLHSSKDDALVARAEKLGAPRAYATP